MIDLKNDIFHTVSITFLKVGVGMSMEGIEQNPIVYDLMSEMAFQHNKVDAKVTSSYFLILLKFRTPTVFISLYHHPIVVICIVTDE